MWFTDRNAKNVKLTWGQANAIRLVFASLLVAALIAKYHFMFGIQ